MASNDAHLMRWRAYNKGKKAHLACCLSISPFGSPLLRLSGPDFRLTRFCDAPQRDWQRLFPPQCNREQLGRAAPSNLCIFAFRNASDGLVMAILLKVFVGGELIEGLFLY